jgi:hypothetical protein
MAVLLEDGVVRGKWSQKMPEFLVDELRKGMRQGA